MIGFGDVTYNVKEGDGSVSISFGVLSGTLGVSVDLIVFEIDDSAICMFCQELGYVTYISCLTRCLLSTYAASLDYSYTPSTYTLSPSSPNQTFTIAILDDGLLEDVESFMVQLALLTTRIHTFISPSLSAIKIYDNDG